jgi:hypothetical protein
MHQQAPFAEWEIFSIPDDTIAFKQLHIWSLEKEKYKWRCEKLVPNNQPQSPQLISLPALSKHYAPAVIIKGT